MRLVYVLRYEQKRRLAKGQGDTISRTKAYNRFKFPPVLLRARLLKDLLKKLTSLKVGDSCPFEILGIVELHCRIRFLQGFGKHSFLR